MDEELRTLMKQMVQHELSVFLAGLGPKLVKVGFPIKEHMNFVVDLDVFDFGPEEVGLNIHLKGKARAI